MHEDTLKNLFLALCAEVFNQIMHNAITEGSTIISSAFWQIEQIVDLVDGPND
jgi:hypothetical protein